MISNQCAKDCVTRLTALKYFPAQAAGAVGEMLSDTCETDDVAHRLTKLALERHSEWPGPKALMELYAAEVALKRPREEQVYCPKCCTGVSVAGHRSGFDVWAEGEYPGGKPELIFPDDASKSYFRLRSELQDKYRGSKVMITGISVFCTCPAGERLANVERQRRSR
jgi:hypothetical protein